MISVITKYGYGGAPEKVATPLNIFGFGISSISAASVLNAVAIAGLAL